MVFGGRGPRGVVPPDTFGAAAGERGALAGDPFGEELAGRVPDGVTTGVGLLPARGGVL